MNSGGMTANFLELRVDSLHAYGQDSVCLTFQDWQTGPFSRFPGNIFIRQTISLLIYIFINIPILFSHKKN